ncbi:RelA/SpoT domain-containing protein [Rhizobium sp. 32-5/1]|uniref:GTP pyrophosphokinase n=1 Tax=Rhizobium sp. 32-5/1 TaxID=3019602 RepID=UPI00240D4156|nr:RelA/SpoT domain-containing protein [Rhizobium sp. 32-5/1]WEZ84811.1 RelA/SpoT domain-containing protein [Rhizobium sp. 32-5/1]
MATKKNASTVASVIERDDDFRVWLEANHKRFLNLKDAVVSIITNLATENGIEVLAIEGRSKDIDSAVEKVRRKDYTQPQSQMTDITGVRVIVYFESDVAKISQVIRSAFRVDEKNSSNTDERMSADQVGYRSVHFVCDLGDDRIKLPEFQSLKDLKFEFQIRTVLQHA